MAVIARHPASGSRTKRFGSASSFNSNAAGKVQYADFAGNAAVPLYDTLRTAANCASIQWGTGASDTPADTAVTATATLQQAGTAPYIVTSYTDGSQMYGDGRIIKNALGVLRFQQKADDALISGNPRCQMYGGQLLQQTCWYRFRISVQFGDATTAWPAYVAGKNTVLFWQFKGDTYSPPLTLQCRQASNGLYTTHCDITLTRRNLTADSDITTANIANVALYTRHDLVVDMYPDWLHRGTGGASYLRLWYNGEPVTLDAVVGGGTTMQDDPVCYAASADNYSHMIGIYRVNYSTKAPNDCAIVFYDYIVEEHRQPLVGMPLGTRLRQP